MTDPRGFFARTVCAREFSRYGLNANFVQVNISYNRLKNTLRGMHRQTGVQAEEKLVRCVRGTIYDVIIDLRVESPMFQKWFAVELSAGNYQALYIPKGCAHGFQTLEDDSEVLYMHTQYYAPGYESNIRWDDPAFAIVWPEANTRILSERDRGWPDYRLE